MRRLMISGTCVLALASGALASHDREFEPPPPFKLHGPSVGGARPAAPAPAFLAGSRIAVNGDGALVIDADSGALILADATGANRGQLAIGRDAGLLAFDPVASVAYVADRRGDRIVVVTVGRELVARASWKTPAEPYGVALAPDRKTLVVTTIADRKLVAFDTATGRQRYASKLGPEPRAVAISPDGTRALVTYLTSAMLDEVAVATGAVTHRGIGSRFSGEIVRGSFATLFLGDAVAVVPFQGSRPVSPFTREVNTEGYGGSFEPPISHHVAFVALNSGRQVIAETAVQQPRALAWDGTRDRLYLAGMGTDAIVEVKNASQVDAARGFDKRIKGCGPDGLAVASDDVLVWCSFTRSIARVGKKVVRGPELVASALDKTAHAGLVQFHTSSERVSSFGQMACANCHFEGRADGLSWQIEGNHLQTPLLAGRLVGTEPFKWDGGARTLETSLRETAGRLGGSGLGTSQVSALAAYLRALPAVRRPTPDVAAATRGAALFESAGCTSCHDGAMYTDQARHELGGNLRRADTPSLVGLAASAPYFHDGSAVTLEAVLRERGRVHGMSETSKQLSAAEVTDLVAFLESL